jgi:hypothetical protein
MNRRHIVSFASIFTPVAIGLAIGLAAQGASASTRDAATGSAATIHATPAAAPKLVLLGCNRVAEVTPAGITNCATPAVGLRGLHWTSWTPHLASGFGAYVQKDAHGHLRSYPAIVALWGSAAVKGHPAEHKYSEMTIIFTRTPPSLTETVSGKTVTVNPGSLTFPTSP